MSDTNSPILLPSHHSNTDDHSSTHVTHHDHPAQHETSHASSHENTQTQTPPATNFKINTPTMSPMNNDFIPNEKNNGGKFAKFDPRGKSPILMFVIAQLLLIAIVGGGYLGYQKFLVKNETEKTNESKSPDDEKKSILDTLAKFIELPSDEPVIMTISDIEKLKDNPFFANAKNEDKVIVFKDSKRAMLFRPSTNKLVEMQTVSLDESPTTTETKSDDKGKVAGASDKITPLKVAILNGTSTAGLATKSKEKLLSSTKAGEIEIIQLGNANNRSYSKGIIFDATGKLSSVVAELAKLFSLNSVKTLPAGETLPSGTQILIIVTQ